LAAAGAVVIGKVVSVEEKNIDAYPYPGAAEKVPHQVAVVMIDRAVVGVKGLTHVRVAFVPQGAARRRYAPPDLTTDLEAVFFLTPQADFFIAPQLEDVMVKNAKDPEAFARQAESVEHWGKLLADPRAGLKSKDADDRLITASMLITRY